jgi:hypothetical protein
VGGWLGCGRGSKPSILISSLAFCSHKNWLITQKIDAGQCAHFSWTIDSGDPVGTEIICLEIHRSPYDALQSVAYQLTLIQVPFLVLIDLKILRFSSNSSCLLSCSSYRCWSTGLSFNLLRGSSCPFILQQLPCDLLVLVSPGDWVIVLSYLLYTLVSPGTCALNCFPSLVKALKVLTHG